MSKTTTTRTKNAPRRPNVVRFEVMQGETWAGAYSVPIVGGVVTQEQMMAEVERQRPALRGTDYRIVLTL